MSTLEHIRAYHANAEKHHLRYPEGTVFPELIELTDDEALIPTSQYTSPQRLQDELHKVWYRTWQMACRQEDIAQPGDYYEYVIGTQSFLIVRGEDRQIRAFHNACRHRGTQLKEGTGNAQDLTCSFHAWCWSLEGELVNVPDRQLFPRVTDEGYRLRQVGCDVWAGFVFIHPDPDRAERTPLREFLGRVGDDIGVYHMERYRAAMHASIQLECNWKAAIEAFLEAYHVSFTHPQILPYLDDMNTVLEVFGDHSRMIVPYGVPSMRIEHVDEAEIYESYFNKSATSFRHQQATDLPAELFDADGNWTADITIREYMMRHHERLGRDNGHDYSQLTREQLVDDYDYHIFPGFKFNSHAGAALGFRARPHASDPNKCIFDVYKFIWPDEHEPFPDPAPMVEVDISQQSMGLVLDQDFGNLAKVQRGMHDKTLEHVTFGSAEVRITNFHNVLARMIAED
jgi:phenylpropionate dioxygenase-like ring-hydroxylating dioxygenase large terminal subunit